MNLILFVLNTVILLSLILDFRTKVPDRWISFGIIRIILILPLLAGSYFLAYVYDEYGSATQIYNSENVFTLLWIAIAYRLYQTTSAKDKALIPAWGIFGVGSTTVFVASVYAYFRVSKTSLGESGLVFSSFGFFYCSSLILLVAVLLMSWRLEAFWRSLDQGDKWRYKYLVLSCFLVCAMLGWSSSYRLVYLSLPREHLLLLAAMIIIAWVGMIYAVARNRLLNRKLFISRKVVYATITPIAFSVFFILIGSMALLTRLFGWTVPFVLQWLIVILGILTIIVLALSDSVRERVKYFVSTHFYVNKYEYRDEWLAFSDLLQGKLSEKGVVEALYHILQDSLYTHNISIWLGDIRKGFYLIEAPDSQPPEKNGMIAGDDPMVCYLLSAPYLYSREGGDDPLRRSILNERKNFLQTHGIVLIVPLILGNQFVGLIGLGPESTGGQYGHDDFDLLAALTSHAASALIAVKNAEELARAREQSAWSNLSAFVLHDIKNAATMLDMARKNAPQHMDNPKFQNDLLESIDDALKRMGKVQNRLSALKVEMVSEFSEVDLGKLLNDCINKLSKKLPKLDIELVCLPDVLIWSDPDFIYRILENLIINSWEAGGDGTAVRIKVALEPTVRIDIQDNGPGILADLLPLALFEPFKTAKPKGSGIGLWQVRKMVDGLGGDIKARNLPGGGAQFSLLFPYRTD